MVKHKILGGVAALGALIVIGCGPTGDRGKRPVRPYQANPDGVVSKTVNVSELQQILFGVGNVWEACHKEESATEFTYQKFEFVNGQDVNVTTATSAQADCSALTNKEVLNGKYTGYDQDQIILGNNEFMIAIEEKLAQVSTAGNMILKLKMNNEKMQVTQFELEQDSSSGDKDVEPKLNLKPVTEIDYELSKQEDGNE